MEVDITGRVRNIKLTHQQALFPLYEAVINSIHAIAELGTGPGKGNIEVRIVRDQQQKQLEGLETLRPVRSFAICDNGIGFNESNFKSFSTADSRQKATIGGKGVGRFHWLKAFDHAEIESTFQDGDGNWQHRAFELRFTPAGVESHNLDLALTQERSTIVRLVDIKKDYQDHVPVSTKVIANRIVEHCLEHFVLGLAPTIVLIDEDSAEKVNLNEIFSKEVQAQTRSNEFQVSNRNFKLHNLKVRLTYDNVHRLHFCAHKRVVQSEKLDGRVPNLLGSLKDEQGTSFVYAGYVSSDYLDERVNTERTGFLLPDGPTLTEVSWPDLLSSASGQASHFLDPFTSVVKHTKEERIKTFVQNKAPYYRPLIKHKVAVLDVIPPNLSDEKLDLELYKLNQDYDTQLREKSVKLLESIQKGESEADGYEEFLQEWNEAGMAKLARHVAHRKHTLQLLRASLSLNEEGKYQLEDAVHGLIFPLKKTSDDVRADQMNLWIVDEKLAFHYYLASDVPLNQLQEDTVIIESQDRPDLLIFNRPAAFVNEGPPFSSVVLVEFKRPARKAYSDEDNPITQLYRYVNQIKGGKAVDHKGRPINVPSHIPFYAYIIADLTEALHFQAKAASLAPSPDAQGYFGYNAQVGVYVEVISFDKLVDDAEKRNAYFFHQLGII